MGFFTALPQKSCCEIKEDVCQLLAQAWFLLWLSDIICAQMLSRVRLSGTPWTIARLLCPWDSLGKNTGVDCHFLLQGIFPTQGLNLHLLCLLILPNSCLFLETKIIQHFNINSIWATPAFPHLEDLISWSHGNPGFLLDVGAGVLGELALLFGQWSEITGCLLAVHLQRLKGCPKALAIWCWSLAWVPGSSIAVIYQQHNTPGVCIHQMFIDLSCRVTPSFYNIRKYCFWFK